MKIVKTGLTILLGMTLTQAFAFSKPPAVQPDTCPAENTIQQTGATYTAPGGWTGVVQRNPGKVEAFEFVLYKPNDINHPFKKGELLRCSYKLDNGQSLDLRLRKEDSSAHITNITHWKAAYSSHQYDCSKSRLACEFNLAK